MSEGGLSRRAAGDVVAGRFRLQVRLYQCDADSAWLGVQLSIGRQVVVRFGRAAELEREARLLSQRPHTTLPTVLDAGDDSAGEGWIAEERPSGSALDAVLAERSQLGAREVFEILLAVTDGLLHAKSIGVSAPLPDAGSLLVTVAPGGTSLVRLGSLGATTSDTWVAAGLTGANPDPIHLPAARIRPGQVVEALAALERLMRRLRPGLSFPEFARGPESLERLASALRRNLASVQKSGGAANEDARPRVGGRYELLNVLGSGGMGRAHRALDLLTGHVVSLKCAAGRTLSGGEEQALTREFQLLAALRHPNLVEVRDYGIDLVVGPYLVTELYEGAQDLRQACADLSMTERIRLFAQLADALGYVHAQQIVHGDLKPANIVVSHGRVRLLDFGISSRLESEGPAGRVAGTTGYLSPELLAGGRPSLASDLWALGVVAREVLTGSGDAAQAGPALATPALPLGLKAVLVDLLATHPGDRRRSAGQVAAELRALVPEGDPPHRGPERELRVSTRFVGRAALLQAFSVAISRAQTRGGDAMLIEGPTGIGKSRLLEEFRNRALLAGVAAVELRAVRESRAPFEVWRPLIRWLALYAVADGLELSVLAHIDPGVVRTEARLPGAPTLSGPETAERLRTTVVSLAQRALRPLLVLVDDVQWLTPDDQVFLGRLCGAAAGSTALVVCAGRVGEVGRIDGLGPAGILGPLLPEEAEELAMLVDPSADRGWLPRAQGVPLLLLECLRDPELATGRTQTETLESVLARRVARLAPAMLTALRQAAVLGLGVEPARLAAALNEPVDAVLQKAREEGVLEWEDGTLRFAHQGLRDALLAPLSEADRARLHDAAAAALAKVEQPDAARIAWHHQRGNNADEASRWALLAGQRALERGSLRDGVAWLDAAGEPADAETRAQVHYQRALAQYALGEGEAGADSVRRALVSCRDPVPTTAPGWLWFGLSEAAELTRNQLFGARRPKGRSAEFVQDALLVLGMDAYTRERPFTGLALAVASLNRAESFGLWGAVARQWGGLQMFFGGVGLHGAARWMGRRAAEAGSRGGSSHDRARALTAGAFYLAGAGRLDQALAFGDAALDTFQQSGMVRNIDEVRLLLGWVHALKGNAERARELDESLLQTATLRGDVQMQAWAAYGLAILGLDVDEPWRIGPALETLDPEASPDAHVIDALRACAAIAEGRYQEACDLAFASDRRIPPLVFARGVHLGAIATSCDALSALALANPPVLAMDQDRIRRALHHRLRHLRRHLREAPIMETNYHLYRARAALSADDRKGASLLYTASIGAAERLGMQAAADRARRESERHRLGV